MDQLLSSRSNIPASNCTSMGTIWSLFKWTDPAAEFLNKTARSRRRDFIELVGIYGLILLVIWTPRPWQWPLWGLTSISIIAVIAVSYEGRQTMGLCSVNLLKSLWVVALAIAIALLAVLFAGRMHTLPLPGSPRWALHHYGGYPRAAAGQHFVLHCFS